MKIAICACSSRTFIDKKKIALLASAATKAGVEVELVSDLCELCEDKDTRVEALAKNTIVACHPRAVKSLLDFAGIDQRPEILNMRSERAEDILKALQIASPLNDATEDDLAPWLAQLEAMPKKLGEDAWYPTLDKDVCAECGKCLEFCPFGVYEMVDDRIRVVHPHNCKNNCPACARTCPASAIIFPKYDRSPINGGEEKQENAIKLDTKELYGQALREKLTARRTSFKLMKD